jgi:hypothetical protein
MKNLNKRQLKQLSDELRSATIFTVSKTGGHLGSSLGVVELTVALHHVFNAPADKILWDVGHQSHMFVCSYRPIHTRSLQAEGPECTLSVKLMAFQASQSDQRVNMIPLELVTAQLPFPLA